MGVLRGPPNWHIEQGTQEGYIALVKGHTSVLATGIFTLYLNDDWFAR